MSLIGYAFAEVGVGEAMRSLARATSAKQIPTEIFNLDTDPTAPQEDRTMKGMVSNTLIHRTNIFCINADVLGDTLRILGPDVLSGRHNVVRPFWELALVPPQWATALDQMDEVWASSRFMEAAFSSVTRRPVIHMPMAVSLPKDIRPNRPKFGLPEGAVLFAFVCNISSHTARKNPMGVVEAFRMAFGDRQNEHVGLVIKTMGNGPGRAAFVELMQKHMLADRRISWIDTTLNRGDTLSLMASCDVFVSLHRSEGFGLSIAESMLLKKPVVATDYSGSRDYVGGSTGFPVPFDLVAVQAADYPYFMEGQVWAEPDVEYAVRVMRTLATDGELRRSKGEEAAAYVHRAHGDKAIGQIVSARLAEIERVRRFRGRRHVPVTR